MTVEVVEVTLAQKEAAQLLIELLERDREPVRDWTRRVAAARPRPPGAVGEIEPADGIVLYLV